jgi:hypothetical protein
MPEVCRFYGIIIRMYYDDHNPPHFHAHYGPHHATVAIGTLAVIAGACLEPLGWLRSGQHSIKMN